MKLEFKLKYLFFLIKKRKFKTSFNYLFVLTVYFLWQFKPVGKLILNKISPRIDKNMYPPFIKVESTTICNLDCSICEHTYWKEPPKNMSFMEFKKIIDQFPSLRWVGLVGIGSSFLNKDFLKMVEYLKMRSTIVEITDTFNHLNKEDLKKLVGIGPDMLFVSIYGGTEESYRKVCTKGDYHKVINNIKTLVNIKKEMKTLLPILNFHFMITKSNVDTIDVFLDFVSSLDTEIGEVLFSPLLHTYKEVEHETIALNEDQIHGIESKSNSLNIPIKLDNWISKSNNKPPIADCTEWILPFFLVTGHITPCCLVNESNQREFIKKTSIGNIFETSFKDIWSGTAYTKLRRMIQVGKVPIQCKTCPIYSISESGVFNAKEESI